MILSLVHLAEITDECERRLEQIFEAFEIAWHAAPHPEIAAYLPDDKNLRWPALVELICIDQEYAIKSGSRDSVEQYLARFPELASDRDIVSDLVTREYRLRRRLGEEPSTDEYAVRFPDLIELLMASLKTEAAGTPRALSESDDGPEKPPACRPDKENPRFINLRFHARGGLGDVYRAHDIELAREVALKRIRLKFVSESRVRRRFLREAKLTARLNHPGVVPIHGLIWDQQGQPWYVMRFVEGKTLGQAIDDYHRSPSSRFDDQILRFRKLLARFVTVCDTIAFAHSRNVIHRDLKPANVILGEYGETLVLDWGLATSPRQENGEDSIRGSVEPIQEGGDLVTQAGQILGTPVFMSPEQAEGLPTMNRATSDIYALGAILYMLLTGRPPFANDDVGSLLREIISGRLRRPREVEAGLPRALEAICLKAMAYDAGERYETASHLARDIERWAADEPVSVWRESWGRRAFRWAKKHRTPLATAASAATVSVVSLVVVAWFQISQRQSADDAAVVIMRQSDDLAIAARASGDMTKWDQAIAEGLRSRERLEGAGSPRLRQEVNDRLLILTAERSGRRNTLESERKDQQVVAELADARLLAGVVDGPSLSFNMVAKNEAYLTAFRRYGLDMSTLTIAEAAQRIRMSNVSDELILALDDWTVSEKDHAYHSRLSAIARSAESDPLRSAIRESITRGDKFFLRTLTEKAEDRQRLGPRAHSVFRGLLKLDPSGSLPHLELIRQEKPDDFWFNHDLGVAYMQARPPQPKEASRCLYVAVALRPNNVTVHNSLAAALESAGDVSAAITEMDMAIRLKPDMPLLHYNLAHVLGTNGDHVRAIAEYRTAIQLQPTYYEAHTNLGVQLVAKGDLDGAIAEYRIAARLKPNDSQAHARIGSALFQHGDLDGALAELRVSARLTPDDADARANLGAILSRLGKHDEAVRENRLATKLNPDSPSAHSKLGVTLSRMGKREEAISEYKIAIKLKPDDPEAHLNLGVDLAGQGETDKALAEFRFTVALDPKRAMAHHNLGRTLQLSKRDAEAILSFQEAIRLGPSYANNHSYLGILLSKQGRIADAMIQYREAVRLSPDDINYRLWFGTFLIEHGSTEEAISQYAEATRRKPNDSSAFVHLARGLQLAGRSDEALKAASTAVHLDPKHGWARQVQAWILLSKGDLAGAITGYREAITLGQDSNGAAHHELGMALARTKDLDAAVQEYRKAIRIDPNHAAFQFELGVILEDQMKIEEAIPAYAEALRLDPRHGEAQRRLAKLRPKNGI